jgi:hypothetical protein
MAQPNPWEALVRQLVSVRHEPRVVHELLRQAEQQIQGVDWTRSKARLTNNGARPWWKGNDHRRSGRGATLAAWPARA